MQGRGVTNFSVDRPSHEYTTATTEFDDELIRRGIVTTEQAMMAKGASAGRAIQLATEKRGGTTTTTDAATEDSGACSRNGGPSNFSPTADPNTIQRGNDDDDDDDGFLGEEDDVFMQRYRQERLRELQQSIAPPSGFRYSSASSDVVRHIRREDWRADVNEASMERWIVVTMVDASGQNGSRCRDRVVQELSLLARENDHHHHEDENDSASTPKRNGGSFPHLLTIEASEAIPNWPSDRVPAMFAYRNGIKRHEWIASRPGEFPGRDLLGLLFLEWGVLGDDHSATKRCNR
jgi:hypothetical protein